MKRLLLSILVIWIGLWLKSCVAPLGERPVVAKLIAPQQSDDMSFGDDYISASFALTTQKVSFNLINRSGSTIKILWDESSIVVNDSAYRPIHSGIKIISGDASQVPTIVPSRTMVSELMMPLENLKLVGNNWMRFDMLKPGYVKGSHVNILLPVLHKNETREYYFQFEVLGIPKKNATYRQKDAVK